MGGGAGDYQFVVTRLVIITGTMCYGLLRRTSGANRIDRFQRLPTDLRKYLEYTSQIKARYGSVMRFVVKERLRWGGGDDLDELKPKGRPFEYDGSFIRILHCKCVHCFGLICIRDAEDIKILYNDWPYGVEHGIIHLVVWTKFELEDDPATDDLTPRARKEIDGYVKKTFCSRVPPEQVPAFPVLSCSLLSMAIANKRMSRLFGSRTGSH